jgi:hypothetical protein
MEKKTEVLCVRFTAEDAEAIHKISKKEGVWASAWIRGVVVEHLIKLGKKKKGGVKISEYGR